MKRLSIFLLVLSCVLPATAQEGKFRIAVFDPTSSGTSIDDGTKIAIREIISSTIVNTGTHAIVERSLLEKVMQEQSFSNSGAVDDNQMTEIGKLAGANKIVVSVVTLTGGRNMLSVKMIDVQTANVERQKVKVVTSGELLDAVEPMTLSLIGVGTPSGELAIAAASDASPAAATVSAPGELPDAGGAVTQGAAPVPAPGELVIYLPAGYQPKKEKDRDLPVLVRLDKKVIGSGTLSGGLLLRVKHPGPGQHVIVVGNCRIKFDASEGNNYFEFQVYRWNYMGKALYGISLREQRKVE